jgi:hypothetical protein
MRDLTDAPADAIAVERARVAAEGFGAQLLALQATDGRWAGAAWNRGWDSTMHVLMLLRDLGLDPASDAARRAVERVRDHVTWQGCGPPECDGNPFFAGEIEPCINAQVAAVGAYFGQDVRGLIDRLVGEQLPDGGWNCEAERGSARSSFHTTICVLEALLEYERQSVGSDGGINPTLHSTAAHQTGLDAVVGWAPPAPPTAKAAGNPRPETFPVKAVSAVTTARLRGQEYLLNRQLFRRESTGEAIIDRKSPGVRWTDFAFPTWWHYDILRGLEHLRTANVPPDARLAEAIDLVRSKQHASGCWPLDIRHSGRMLVEIEDAVGSPSRWNTLRALRVLRWL